jgi:hypothetical protein
LLRSVVVRTLSGKSADDSILIAVRGKYHRVAKRMCEPLFHIWLDFEVYKEFTHKINIKISANLGKIIEKTPSLRYFLIFSPIFLGEKA